MQIIEYYSPNYNKKERSKKSIKIIVIHYTGMQSERESLNRLCNVKSKVGCHYLINKNGKIFRLVRDKNTAWHAGKSRWSKYRNLNECSIGIELVNKGHQFGYTSFTQKQILQLIILCKILIKKYKIPINNIIGHSDIAPTRKIDPGEKFPWKILSKHKIGIWFNLNPKLLKKFRKKKIEKKQDKIKFFRYLNKVGYCTSLRTNNFVHNKILKAFQRHYRKDLINGLLDQECLIIASNLAKKT